MTSLVTSFGCFILRAVMSSWENEALSKLKQVGRYVLVEAWLCPGMKLHQEHIMM